MRQVVNGVMYVLGAGCQWRYIPGRPAAGGDVVHDYLTRWNYDGTIEMIHHALAAMRGRWGGKPVRPPA